MTSFHLVAAVEGTTDHLFVKRLVEVWERRLDWAEGPVFAVGGLDDVSEWLDIHKIPAMAKERGLPRLRSGLAGVVRQTQLVIRDAVNEDVRVGGLPVDGAIILTDTDGNSVESDTEPRVLSVAVGFPHECIEAWAIACHQPSNEARRQETQRLGFDPFRHPERLSHKENVPRSAKDLTRRHEITIGGEQGVERLLRLVESPEPGDTDVVEALEAVGATAFVKTLGVLLCELSGHPSP